MKSLTYLIVGQGIAGTLLAHFLLQADCNVFVIDNHHKGASSKAAAGIINPITGRKYVKSWRIDDLLPIAKQTYQELEQLLSIRFYYNRNVIRAMSNAKEWNDWSLRTLESGYAKYISEEVNMGTYHNKITTAYGYGEVLHGAQVNLPLLIHRFRQFLHQQNRILDEAFDYNQLEINLNGVHYKNLNADKIIFCEGAKAMENPFFNYLPFRGDKGEALIIKAPGANFEKMLKQQIFIIPLDKGDLYWIGSTYNSKYINDLPSDAARDYLLHHLKNLLKVSFEVVEHLAAIRPTVKDRRPLLGLHPHFPQLIIFNGLGTKGASLGPYWAKHLADFLIKGQSLDEEVDIKRFAHQE